jgi:hypothetical protein
MNTTSTTSAAPPADAHPVVLNGDYAVGALQGLNIYRGELLAVAKLADVVLGVDVEALQAAAGHLALASDGDGVWRVVEALQQIAALNPASLGSAPSVLGTLVELTDAAVRS